MGGERERGREKERERGGSYAKFYGPGLEVHSVFPPTFHWPEVGHVATPECKEVWEM